RPQATWIEIPEDFIINAAESPIEQIVKETFPDFTTKKSDSAYLKERAILTPRNDDADAINAYIPATSISRRVSKYVKLPKNAASCPQPKEGTSNNALTECKPKPGSVQRDTADHHRPKAVYDSGLNPYQIRRRGDRSNIADRTHIHTNTMAFHNETATIPCQTMLRHDNKQKSRAVT
ncbi:ATP-dependent DNA helicase PIF1-like protein, partial [Tanacetum coccineum]